MVRSPATKTKAPASKATTTTKKGPRNRQPSRAATSSKKSSLHVDKTAAYDAARSRSRQIVTEGNLYFDAVLEKVTQLKNKESTLKHTRPDFDKTLEALKTTLEHRVRDTFQEKEKMSTMHFTLEETRAALARKDETAAQETLDELNKIARVAVLKARKDVMIASEASDLIKRCKAMLSTR